MDNTAYLVKNQEKWPSVMNILYLFGVKTENLLLICFFCLQDVELYPIFIKSYCSLGRLFLQASYGQTPELIG